MLHFDIIVPSIEIKKEKKTMIDISIVALASILPEDELLATMDESGWFV